MPSVLSKPAVRRTASLAFVGGLAATALLIRKFGEKASRSEQKQTVFTTKKKSKQRVGVDGVFYNRLVRLLKICVPGVFTPEAGYLALVAAMMVSRTLCDLWMISINTTIERTIITRDPNAFVIHLTRFILSMLPISCVNNLLKYGLQELAIRFRNRMTLHLYNKYLQGYTYYGIVNLDNRIANVDQLLTQDVERFCKSVSDLYSNISKPLLDILIYSRRLSAAIGAQGPGSMIAYLLFSGVLLTWLRRPTGRLTMREQQLEGEFRAVNARLITYSEEVAFYNGNSREKTVIVDAFHRLLEHVRTSQQFRFSMGVIDDFIAKYFATVVGFFVVSRPFLDLDHPRHANSTHSEIMEDYFRSGRMLMRLAGAIGRLVLAGRELTRLAGFTARVTELMDVLRDLNNGRYQRTMVSGSSRLADGVGGSDGEKGEGGEGEGEGGEGKGKETGEVTAAEAEAEAEESGSEQQQQQAAALAPNSGVVEEVDHLIRFEHVPVVTPNGDVLLPDLHFEVPSGRNVLVAGPNGCGKSSLFRILGGLWPLFGGKLLKPAQRKLFYVPQKPYLALGTLRDQVIYPDSHADMLSKGITDDDIMEFLTQVHLGALVEREEDGWDSVQDWADRLSGGEKQRVAMARLFYHKPQFAILDECTSAVSVDVEGFMYTHCREIGITLFTVSHRHSLWKYHEYVLRFDGRGSYLYLPIDDPAVEQFGS